MMCVSLVSEEGFSSDRVSRSLWLYFRNSRKLLFIFGETTKVSNLILWLYKRGGILEKSK